MRILRRSVALLLHLLLLQVSVLGGGAACAVRAAEPGQRVAPEAAPVHGAHHGEHDAAPAAHAHGGDADRPATGSPELPHCGLAAACLAPALASRAEPLPATTPAAGQARVAEERAPRSAAAAPEPPPPRP